MHGERRVRQPVCVFSTSPTFMFIFLLSERTNIERERRRVKEERKGGVWGGGEGNKPEIKRKMRDVQRDGETERKRWRDMERHAEREREIGRAHV